MSLAIAAVAVIWLCCFAQAVRAANAWWIVGPPVAGAVTHFAVLTFELLMQRSTSRRAGIEAPASTALGPTALREMVVAWRTFLWDLPFGSRRFPDMPGSAGDGAGVVLIHGLFCNRGLWNGWMMELRRRAIPFVAIDLEPPFASIDDYRPVIDAAVDRLLASTGVPPIIVGHSMGGLAARAWASIEQNRSRAHRIVTIGSPHHGTVLSRFSTATNARQMARGSSWLRELADRETADATAHLTCFHSICDNVIIPWTSACLIGADNRRVARRPHLGMLREPVVLAEVLRLVRDADRLTPPEPPRQSSMACSRSSVAGSGIASN